MTLHCAEIKGYNNIALLLDAFAGEATYVPHCTCRDAGATVQRSRKVATISHEYVVAWTTAQERQGTTLRRDAGSIVQRSRKVATNRHEYTSLPGRLRRRGKVDTVLRRDAGSIVQRSRKVATNCHEYVIAWMPVQERQGIALRRDAGSTAQISRMVVTDHREYVTAWTPAQERQRTYRTA